MPEFRTAKLIDLPIQFIDGDRSYRYPKKEEFQNDGIPFLNSAAIVDNKIDYNEINFISHEKFTQLSKGKLQPQDIVMTTRGNGIGKVALFNNSEYSTGFINAQMLIVRADSKNFDQGFLFYLLSSATFYEKIWNYASGAAQPQIPIRDLREIEINYPNLPIQRKIADILSAYDDLIEVNGRRIRVLEAMAQSVYREWFGNVDAKSLPRGWEMVKLGDAFETLGGSTPSTKVPEYWEDGDVNWYSPTDLTANKAMFIRASKKQITQEGLKNSSAKMFPRYCVMMTSRATIGVVSINATPACTNQGFITCIPNERVSVYQIYFWILDNKEKIDNVASGATFKEIGRGEFREFDFVVPDETTKKKFDEIMSPIGKQIETLLLANANLRRTRDLLLPRLVSGEVVIE